MPIKWAKKYDLQKGDELNLSEEGNALLITTSNEKSSLKESKLTIPSGKTEGYVRSMIGNAYKKGYDKVIVNFDDSVSFGNIQKIVDGLLGFEIIQQSRNSCIIESVVKGVDVAFENMLRKSFLTVISLGKSCLEDLKLNRYDRWEEILSADKNLEKFTDFCKRLLNKRTFLNDIVSKYYYLLVWDLEKAGKEFKYVYRYLSEKKKVDISDELVDFFEQAVDYTDLFYTTYYKRIDENIDQLTIIKNNLLFEKIYPLLTSKKKDDLVVAHHVANLIRRIFELRGPYFGIRL